MFQFEWTEMHKCLRHYQEYWKTNSEHEVWVLKPKNVTVTIGIIGITYPATIDLIEKLKGLDSCCLIIATRAVHEFDLKDWKRAGELLCDSLLSMDTAAKSMNLQLKAVCMAANTTHVREAFLQLETLSQKLDCELLSIPKLVCKKAAAQGYKSVGICGTKITMAAEGDLAFYVQDFENSGIQVVFPTLENQDILHNLIRTKLIVSMEEMNFENAQILVDVMGGIKADAIALACTELPMLLTHISHNFTCIDTIQVLVDAIFDRK